MAGRQTPGAPESRTGAGVGGWKRWMAKWGRRRRRLSVSERAFIGDLLDPARCLVCAGVDQAVNQYVDALFYEFVNDPEIRNRIRDARGFCPGHTRLVLERGDALGGAILYQDVVTALTKGRASFGSAVCPVCQIERATLARYLAVVDRLTVDRPPPVCWPHLTLFLAPDSPASAEGRERLWAHHRRLWMSWLPTLAEATANRPENPAASSTVSLWRTVALYFQGGVIPPESDAPVVGGERPAGAVGDRPGKDRPPADDFGGDGSG